MLNPTLIPSLSFTSAFFSCPLYGRYTDTPALLPIIALRYPLAYTYFTRTGPSGACGEYNSSYGGKRDGPLAYDNLMEGVKGKYILANNGWIWGNSDPMKDFAAPGSNGVLLRVCMRSKLSPRLC